MRNKERPIDKYKRWWLNKQVRQFPDEEYKLVTAVTFIGPPSGVYGDVWFEFADGTQKVVQTWRHAPAKKDVEVRDESRRDKRSD